MLTQSILPRQLVYALLVVLLFSLPSCDYVNRVLYPSPSPKWQIHIASDPNTHITAPVEVAYGMVFVAVAEFAPRKNLYLQALKASDGRLVWHLEVDAADVAKPVAQDGMVIFSSLPFAPLYGVDASTGVPKWKFSATDQYQGQIPSRPVVRDGVIYIACTCRRNAGMEPKGRVLAIDIQTGKSIWEIDLENPKNIPPAVTSDMVYYVDGDNLHAVDRETAKEKWKSIIGTSTSVVVANDTVYSGGFAELLAFDTKIGVERWRIPIEKGRIETVSISGDNAYVGVSDFKGMVNFNPLGYLYAIDLKTRQVKWRFDDRPISTVIEDHDLVYFSTSDTLYAVDETTGKTKWMFGGYLLIDSTPVDGIMYIGDSKGNLYALPVN